MALLKPKFDQIQAIRTGEAYVYELPCGATGTVSCELLDMLFEPVTTASEPEAAAPGSTTLGKVEKALLAAVIAVPGKTVTQLREHETLDGVATVKGLSRAATSLMDKGLVIGDGKQRNRALFPTQAGRDLAKLKEIV